MLKVIAWGPVSLFSRRSAKTRRARICALAMASLAESRFKYFASVLSMALATPSEPGLLDDEAMIGSPGCVTSVCAYAVLLATANSKQASSPKVLEEGFCITNREG